MNSIIDIENLTFEYTRQNAVLKDINFQVKPQEFFIIAGPNGAGKSTLLNLLCRAIIPKSGTIRIDGATIESYNTRELAEKIAVVRQEHVPIFGFSVIETVMMARTPFFSPLGFENEADRKIVNEALEVTETDRFASRPLANLSGGERQRVFIARALAQNTPILLLDEPTSFLDLKHQVAMYDLLKLAQSQKGKTIVAVTHDINLAAQYCDELLLLSSPAAFIPHDDNLSKGTYFLGEAKKVLSPDRIEKVFGVSVFTGRIGKENFFIPIGKYARDRNSTLKQPQDS
jgi:iron complex transport system ATP-binding protein